MDSSPEPGADGGDPHQGRPIIYRAEGLTKSYGVGGNAVHALRGVDFEIAEGEMLVLLGPSGSGKSTLLNILGGLDHASAGHAWFYDRDITQFDDDALTEYRRRSVGFIFQFYNLVAALTARENVSLITEISDDPMDPAEALALVGLEERLDHFPAELSGGEQQRVAIARAIAKRPKVLLCDEPTGALDSQTGTRVLAALDQVNRELGTTTFIITHNAVIADMADEVMTFGDGRITGQRHNALRVPPMELNW
ncbi:putative ABC transport system ATP-binding protein [Sphingomonas sp. YR710]|uniref:ABC transporter ATP-binding protein n=1 Tax=Sphingomonas sp. YR710 TaxID=1882773 RepID=UPI00088E2651|nr:ABC transporter ATP-binding protein [Sphingomonas sp. YR710]SDD81004.1 putative ABC transport system ATP-binding protein [Sphingomonas sp. YR710]